MDMHATTSRAPHTQVVDGHLHLRLGSATADLAAGQEALHAFLEAGDVGARALYRAELAFEELVTNVVRHGYGDRSPGTSAIDVTAEVYGDEIVLTVEDGGPPFDPSQAIDAPLPTRIEDARIGGLGLRLVRMAARRIDYERVGDRNRVIIGIPRGS
jgi:serine/threonine-protein kinase RsbW